MIPDFTLTTYKQFLDSLLKSDYLITGFDDFVLADPRPLKAVILRHDIDKNPANALLISRIEKDRNVKATYYFKNIKNDSEASIIQEIVKNGHSIGYHYRELALCQGNYQKAIELFEYNLSELKKIYPVKSICMDGNPLSRYDNRDLWRKYNYRDFGIIAEPYLDIDYKDVLYLTDSARRWDGQDYIVRDKVVSGYQFRFKSTFDIINAFHENKLPGLVMINTHPERWNDNIFRWFEEYAGQNLKNLIKKYFFVKN